MAVRSIEDQACVLEGLRRRKQPRRRSPQPQWPDLSKPDTRGGGNGEQKK